MEPRKIIDRWAWPSYKERYERLRYTPTHRLPSRWEYLQIWWKTPTKFQQLIKQEEQLYKNIKQATLNIAEEKTRQKFETVGMGILGGIAVIGKIMVNGTKYEQLANIGCHTGLVIVDEIKHSMNNKLDVLNQQKEDAINQKDLFLQENKQFIEQKEQRAMYPYYD